MKLSDNEFKQAVIPKRYKFVWDNNYIPHNIIKNVIKAFSKKDDIIFDPFGNNSIVSIESSAFLNLKTINYSSDLVSLQRLKYTLLKNLELKELENIYDNIIKNLEVQNSFIYDTICPVCRKRSSILGVIWKNNKVDSIKYECDNCRDCEIKELDKEDIEKILEIEKYIFAYFIPENLNKYFKKRNSLALASLYYAIEMLCEGELQKLFKTIFFALIYDIYEDINTNEFIELNAFTYFKLKFREYILMLEETQTFILDMKEENLISIDSFDELNKYDPNCIFTILPTIKKDDSIKNIIFSWFSSYKQELIKEKYDVNNISILIRSICLMKKNSKIGLFYHKNGDYELYKKELKKLELKKILEKEFITTDIRGKKHECCVIVYEKIKDL